MRAPRIFAALVIGVAILATLSSASGQPGSSSTGELRLLVFIGSEPAAGVTVLVEGIGSKVTTGDGTVEFDAPEGKYQPRIWIPRGLLGAMEKRGGPCIIALREVEVVVNEESEAIVSLGSACEIADVYLETPANRGANRAAEEAFQEKLKNAPKGTITGKVVATVDGQSEAVSAARVFVRGAPTEAETGADGRFSLELPEGTYDLVVIHARYTTANQKGVVVTANQAIDLSIQVEKATPQLEDFVVTAPYIEGGVAQLVAEKRESSNVSEVIGAEEISRSGDSDAAGALKRVTGITVVGGRFVYVRGMGERYSSTLVNGQFMPSPEPERRVVPLDLFSTDVLESVVIQKTPSADSPGEFGGGVVQLRTKGIPDEFIASVGVSTSFHSNTTFQDRPNYDGGSLDFLGTDDGDRALPQTIRDNSPLERGNRFEDGFTDEDLAKFARTLQVNYDVEDQTVAPNRGFNFSLGTPFDVGDMPAGFLLAASYGDDFYYEERINRRFVASGATEDGLDDNNDFLISSTERTVSASAILSGGIQPAPGHDIRSTTLLLRISTDETAVVTGTSDDLGTPIERFRLRFLEQQLFVQQLLGTHEFEELGGGKLEWRYAYSRAFRDEPDRREYFYQDFSREDEPPDLQISGRPAGNQRVFGDLVDQLHDFGVDWTQPFELFGRDAMVKFGGLGVIRDRDFQIIRLTLNAPDQLSEAERRLRPEEIWSIENLNAETGWVLEDTTQPTDQYVATQGIQAGYAMTTLPLLSTVELTAGVRVERSKQQVDTFSPFDEDPVPMTALLNNTDVLPSGTLKWALSDEWVVRGGFGRSVTRPDFRELSPSFFRDVVTATRFQGNPNLQRGTIDNFDARVEYYFSTDESASIGAFYKDFTSPIEQVDLGGVERTITWQNAESATNVGIEIDARKRLGFIRDYLEDAFVSINAALIRSEVVLGEGGEINTSQERPLQGQSPFVINMQLGYDDMVDSGVTAVLLYNIFGERIRDVGRFGTPDVKEQPFHQIDFVLGVRLAEDFKLKFKAQNLVNQNLQFLQGQRVQQQVNLGRRFGVSLSWSY